MKFSQGFYYNPNKIFTIFSNIVKAYSTNLNGPIPSILVRVLVTSIIPLISQLIQVTALAHTKGEKKWIFCVSMLLNTMNARLHV